MKMENFIKATLVVFLGVISCSESVFGQSVSINSTGAAPHVNAILDVSTTGNQGVLLARMTTATRAAWTPTTSGVTVYDTDTESYWYWNDTINQWMEIPNTAGIVTTLDGAYDGGGSGVGRVIIADAGAVDIQGNGGLLVNGITGIGTSSPDAGYKMTVLNGAGPTVKIGGPNTGLGLLVEANAGAEDGISSIHSSTSNTSAYYAIRGEVSNESGVGYLGYHTAGDNSYAVYGQSGTYAGYFDGHVNITGELQLNGSAGTSGQVLVSQGSGTDPIWGSAGVQSVTAGAGLLNSGTATAPVLDVAADNGLNVDAGQDRVQLGGPLTEATTISLGAHNLTFNLNGIGDFVIQDGGVNHFEIVDNDGNAFFGGDVSFMDQSTTGTILADITDAGVGGNDGRLQLYNDGVVNHTIHADGDVIFNDLGNDRNFRIESDNQSNMFFLDAGTDRIGIGIGTPTAQLHTTGTLRFANYTNGFLQVDGSGNVSTATGSSLFTAGTGLSWSGTTLNSVWTASGNDIHSNNADNVGIGTTTPDAKLNVGGVSGGNLLLTREGSPTVGQVLGSLLFDAQGTSVSTMDASAVIRAIAAENQGNSNKGGSLSFLTKPISAGLGTAATEHMRITSQGNVGIGDQTPDAKLDVDAATGNLLILAQSGTQRMLVDINGNATISGKFNSNGIQESSDKRFKKNIEPLQDALSNVLKLQGVSYDWKVEEFPDRMFGSRTEIGVIAQDIEKIYPELVSTDKDGYKSVQYSHLVPVLVEAIKEQQALILEMKESQQILENRYASIKEFIGSLERNPPSK